MKKKKTYSLDVSVLQEVVARFGMDLQEVKLLKGNVNIVYECRTIKGDYIFRFTPSERRTDKEITAEAQFINYLSKYSDNVCEIIPSKKGRLVEPVDNLFYAICMEKVAGKALELDRWNNTFFYNWGRMLGKFHALAKEYQPKPSFRRKEWYEEEWYQPEKQIPADQTQVRRQALTLFERINRFPKTKDTYGLTHHDLHSRNFHIQEGGKLVAFDFDDCCYSWFIYDIAICLYHCLTRISKPPQLGEKERFFTIQFLQSFLDGYRQENLLEEKWLKWIHDFLKLRRILIYIFYHMDFDLTDLSEDEQRILYQMRVDIEEDRPVIEEWYG